jgi:hypothetical protein
MYNETEFTFNFVTGEEKKKADFSIYHRYIFFAVLLHFLVETTKK